MDERGDLSYTPARAPQTTVYHPLTLPPSPLHVWYAKDMTRVFSLNRLSCIYYGHMAPVIEMWSVFLWSRLLLNANGVFVIIGQSSCSRSSNHHCHLASLS